MIAADLLKILRCPATRQTLVSADPDTLARLNAAISTGRLHNAAGQAVLDPFDAALLRADGSAAYPVRDGIPVLLADEAVVFS